MVKSRGLFSVSFPLTYIGNERFIPCVHTEFLCTALYWGNREVGFCRLAVVAPLAVEAVLTMSTPGLSHHHVAGPWLMGRRPRRPGERNWRLGDVSPRGCARRQVGHGDYQPAAAGFRGARGRWARELSLGFFLRTSAMDAASDPYLPYDGGGDCIPLRELHKPGNAGCGAGPGRTEADGGSWSAVPSVRSAAAVCAQVPSRGAGGGASPP